jgi:hypothetical protein
MGGDERAMIAGVQADHTGVALQVYADWFRDQGHNREADQVLAVLSVLPTLGSGSGSGDGYGDGDGYGYGYGYGDGYGDGDGYGYGYGYGDKFGPVPMFIEFKERVA